MTLHTPGINQEILAGVLLVVTVVIIGGIILLLAEDPELFRQTYGLTVEFSDASGLTKGSDVYLSGALIGKVVSNPQPVPGQQRVAVSLKNKFVPLGGQGLDYRYRSSLPEAALPQDSFVRSFHSQTNGKLGRT